MVSALLQLDAIPAGMELFPAADEDAWTLILRVIEASDYYLLVVGGKYGSIDPTTELSYTEREFDYAGRRSPSWRFSMRTPMPYHPVSQRRRRRKPNSPRPYKG